MSKSRFGVGYQGSKNQIASDIVAFLPRGKRFVDLFAGGCAVTHAAMLSGKYERFVANDLHGMGVRLFVGGINGEFDGRFKTWVTRDEFYAKRDTDPLIAICWSFGNNQSQYVYSEDIEESKHVAHEEYVNREDYESTKPTIRLQSDERMRCVKHLQSLQAMNGVKHLQASFKSYEDVPHEEGDVVYCDIPYRSATETYRFMKRSGITFDFDKFYAWALSRDYPVFVSEYEMPSDFVPVWTKTKLAIFNKISGGGMVFGKKTFSCKRRSRICSHPSRITARRITPRTMFKASCFEVGR